MRRRLFNFAALTSMLICAALLIGWACSARRRCYLRLSQARAVSGNLKIPYGQVQCIVQLQISSRRAVFNYAKVLPSDSSGSAADDPSTRWAGTVGLERFEPSDSPEENDGRPIVLIGKTQSHRAVLPLSLLAAIAALPAIVWLARRRRDGLRIIARSFQFALLMRIATVISTIGFIIVAAGWPLSYYAALKVVNLELPVTSATLTHWTICNGTFSARRWSPMIGTSSEPWQRRTWTIERIDPANAVSKATPETYVPTDGFHYAGVRVGRPAQTTSRIARDYSVHAWLPFAITGALPTLSAWKWVTRRQRHRAGSCRQCGYDLRATPERCPECGLASQALAVK